MADEDSGTRGEEAADQPRRARLLPAAAAIALAAWAGTAHAQPHLLIKSFSVGPDETLSYPDTSADPPFLLDLADEHSTLIPLGGGPEDYLLFGASRLSGANGTGGAVVLQTSDLKSFTWAAPLGYARQVFAAPVAIDQCNAAYLDGFDSNYAAPGSVVQDPTQPPGNLIMLYEAENHCPGGTNQHNFYATVGFARSSDGGKTWPPPADSVLGDADRHPVLKSVNPQPASPGYSPMGDAIPSAFVETDPWGDHFLYVLYGYHDGGMAPAADGLIRMARAELDTDPPLFLKWYQTSFNQPGIGGLDSGVLPGPGCAPDGQQHAAEMTYNDDLGLYLMDFVCFWGPAGSRVGAWYYATATSLDRQDWTMPEVITGSQFPVTEPCPGLTTGQQFDGYYPSFVSPGADAGHTKLTGTVFFINGCDTGKRTFTARTFTIVAEPSERARRHVPRSP